MESSNEKAKGPLTFEEVLKAEVEFGCRPKGHSIGLALSGGGIRSATFNLGVLQALAEVKWLQKLDYLSTISGGGYIGSWLTTFISRIAHGSVAEAEQKILQRNDKLENDAIRFLRAYSNYLTPRTGLSADTLSAIATYLRNMMLNLTMLIALLAALLVAPRLMVLLQEWMVINAFGDKPWRYELYQILLLLPVTLMIGLNLLHRPVPAAGSGGQRSVPWYSGRYARIGLMDIPLLAAAWMATVYYLWFVQQPFIRDLDFSYFNMKWIAATAALYVSLWVVGAVVASVTSEKQESGNENLGVSWYVWFVVSGIIAGALGGLLLAATAKLLGSVPGEISSGGAEIAKTMSEAGVADHRSWFAASFGPPLFVLSVLTAVVVHVGLMGRKFQESHREIWSAFGGRYLSLSVCWLLLFVTAFYAPALVRWAYEWVVGLGGVAWVAATLFGVLSGKSPSTGRPTGKPTGKPESGGMLDMLTRIAPYLFVAGLLVLLSYSTHHALRASYESSHATAVRDKPAESPDTGVLLRAGPEMGSPVVTVRVEKEPTVLESMRKAIEAENGRLRAWFDDWWVLLAIIGGALAVVFLLAWRVNINLFSLHHFYRNRLARGYLGATNPQRNAHALIGFDPDDDMELHTLKQKPLHILGTAINLNRGTELGWQNRRAASFMFTPLHCGFEPASRVVRGGFRSVAEYGMDSRGRKIEIGTAVAISGAAASPNMGFHTSAAVAFLLTVFNVRLGHWSGNPRHRHAWKWRDPIFSLRYLLAELTGSADENLPYVNLSDGGHFENLGIYELVRRQCAVIIASDAGADPDYAFDDLAEAIRKCYTDFGATIIMEETETIRPASGAGEPVSRQHYAVGTIDYGGGVTGTLIYWKASLTPEMQPDITNYKRRYTDFPHQTTADQFFDESQFESYRHLGQELARRSIADLRKRGRLPAQLA